MRQEAEQMSIFDQDLWCGKTCPEYSAPTEEQTSEQFSKRRSKLSAVKPPPIPMFGKGWPPSGCLADVEGKWSVAWRVFDAQFWGVPQRRRRIALVADFGGLAAPEILFERESVSGDSKKSTTAWKRAAAAFEDCAGKAGAVTLKTRPGCEGGGKGALIQYEKSGTPFYASGQTLFQPAYCIQGNCIDRADTAGCNGKGWTEDVSYTLNTIDRPAVVQSVPLLDDQGGA